VIARVSQKVLLTSEIQRPGHMSSRAGHRIAVDQRLLKLCLRRIACVYHRGAPGNQAFGAWLLMRGPKGPLPREGADEHVR
jgi:hypothetical protein